MNQLPVSCVLDSAGMDERIQSRLTSNLSRPTDRPEETAGSAGTLYGDPSMTEDFRHPLQLTLTDRRESSRIVVSMDSFFDFSFWLAEELEVLVSQWSHLAAPRAKQSQENASRSSD